MVYTELAPRRQQFHAAPAMQQPNSTVSTPLWWVFKQKQNKNKNKKLRYKRLQSLIQNPIQHERSETAREQRTAKLKRSIIISNHEVLLLLFLFHFLLLPLLRSFLPSSFLRLTLLLLLQGMKIIDGVTKQYHERDDLLFSF